MAWSLFGRSRPRCPLVLAEKVWVETRLRWIIDNCQNNRPTGWRVVLPTRTFFPESFDGTDAGLQRHFEVVCRLMGLPHERFILTAIEGREADNYSGLYVPGDRPEIRINRSTYSDEEHLITTLSHELSHDLLLGRGLLDGDELDHEWMTDLYLVYAGFGVFHANTAVRLHVETYGTAYYTHYWKAGYIPARFTGYAMALLEWLDQTDGAPDWLKAMTSDGRVAARDGLAFLRNTDDSLITPNDLHTRGARWSSAKLLDELKSDSPSHRLVAIHIAREIPDLPASVTTELMAAVHDDDVYLRGDSLVTLSHVLPSDAPQFQEITEGLFDTDQYVRRSAAIALGVARQRSGRPLPNEPAVVHALASCLKENDRMLVEACIRSLKYFGSAADPLIPRIIRHLANGTVDQYDRLINSALVCLERLRPGIDQWLPDAVAEHAPHAVDQLPQILADYAEAGNDADDPWTDRLPLPWQSQQV